MEQNRKLKCQDCGKIDDTVTETTCPYAMEMFNNIVNIVVCDNCYYERVLDV